MSKRFGTAVIAAAGLCLLARPVPAQVTDPSKGEQKCESNTGKTLAKFVGAKGKCISKCMGAQRKVAAGGGTPDYTLCLPKCTDAGCSPTIPSSYADVTANACIFDSVKGAEAKAGTSVAKLCNDVPGKDNCPECYSAAQCSASGALNPWVQTTEGDIDAPFANSQLTAFPRLIYCTETGGATPGKDQAKCEDGVTKALAKFVGAKQKCYDKCTTNSYKTGAGRGVCQPPTPVDPAANACIHDPVKGAEAKASAAITKACPTPPSCYSAGFANTFVSSTESKVDQRTPQIACGSPSGAFLQ
jgi:hypothetical protein